jgi:predicted ribosome quality control (RQC) complex YloA/Tae2 family protein
MKDQLSALDIFILVKELKKNLCSGRIQKIYDFFDRGIRLEIYSFNEQKEKELILMPPIYFCLTKYERKTLKQPSSFVMQLRKYLTGSVIREINQHSNKKELDRIVEFTLEKKNGQFLLICEFFSKGNIFLCDARDRRIIGLLEKQKWKDRTLCVGEEYKYPPKSINPLNMDFSTFQKILKDSKGSLIATLAKDLNLGGTYAEELCFLSKIEKRKDSNQLKKEEIKRIFALFQELMKKVKRSEKIIKPTIILEKDAKRDVVPLHMEIYKKFEKKNNFSSFNDAIDEYFFDIDLEKSKNEVEKKFSDKLKKLELMKEKQIETIKNLEKKELEAKEIADTIYQNLAKIEKILKLIRESKNREELIGKEIDGIKIKSIEKTSLIIEI